MKGFDDPIQEAIADFSSRIEYNDLKPEVITEAKYRVLDSLAVSIASLGEKAISILRRGFIGLHPTIDGSTIWYTDFKTIPEYAAFVNGSMVRALDFNDTYLSREPQHPSDMIAALYAANEYAGLDGRDLLRGIIVGYEVGIRLCDSASLRINGWDHVNYTMVGAVAGLGNMLRLSSREIGEALAIAVTPHIALRQTRAGKIKMWKASAASDACRHALYSIYLASIGFEGPYKPFNGEMGFIKQLNLDFDVEPIMELENLDSPTSILKSYMKFHPVEYHAQSAVDAIYRLRDEYGFTYDDIDMVEVATINATYDIIVKHPEKWSPETRETADHSLPYIVAYTLTHGDIWIDSFDGDRLSDPRVRDLMSRMRIYVDEELDSRYPEEVPNRVIIKLRDGSKIEETVYRPRGYPGSGYDVEKLLINKVKRLMKPYYPDDRVDDIISIVLNLEKYTLYELSEALVI
ncbi:TPA: MmgE/PrpD family protein [Candidatus Geothermarchaeota archaeon]|nr:MmgE/PrpD family protein [Candidatus Geothermarchaeota archaeon]